MKKRKDEEPAAVDAPVETERAEPRSSAEADLAALARERDEYLENWKRAAADYQNLRRRLQSDVDAAVAARKAALLAELLLVLDYLDMALATPVKTDEGKTLRTGVEATRSALLGTLEREGVKPMPEGGRFDPAVHDCVATEDAADRESGEILSTLRRGYTVEGRVLRPAQVRVAGDPEGSAPRGEVPDESAAD